MIFYLLNPRDSIPATGPRTAHLRIDYWNDYSYVTMFHLSVYDENGTLIELGNVKIGFVGQTVDQSTRSQLPESFQSLGSGFFTLGQGVKFYRECHKLGDSLRKDILSSLNDIVENPSIIETVRSERVFEISLLRDYSLSTVLEQFKRVLGGGAELTDFDFTYSRPDQQNFGGVDLDFKIKVSSLPSTNIHALIGRNGVGKTTILNGMIRAITDRENIEDNFFQNTIWGKQKLGDSYFSRLVSVSFSAFDPFTPPPEQPNPANGTCYFYIGLKHEDGSHQLKTMADLQRECAKGLINCFLDKQRSDRWYSAIKKLSSDENFGSMNLGVLKETFEKLRETENEQADTDKFLNLYLEKTNLYLSRMSSGHAIVFLTITRLVATVEEKTLVLIDEPESHLHPPLLAAFVRALSDLLLDRNGVAIIATHSPVVLQEVPKSCVWKVTRRGADIKALRPEVETFGENVGVLTSEVFRLEVEKSGFHELLKRNVDEGQTYESIMDSYNHQLGFEARAILRVLIAERDRGVSESHADV